VHANKFKEHVNPFKKGAHDFRSRGLLNSPKQVRYEAATDDQEEQHAKYDCAQPISTPTIGSFNAIAVAKSG